MADDDAAFLQNVRAAMAAATGPVDASLNQARRVLEWLRDAELERPEKGADDVSPDEDEGEG